MNNMERTVKELAEAREFIRTSKGTGGRKCRLMDACDNAVSFLQGKEPIKPIKKEGVTVTATYCFACTCGAPLLKGQPYCGGCGKEVNWND